MKKLVVVMFAAIVATLTFVGSAPATHDRAAATAILHGHVYYGSNFGGGPVSNALVSLSGSCGSHQYRTNSAGRWPQDAGLIVNAPCSVTVQASSGGCIQYYSDSFTFTAQPGINYEITNNETHSVRVCSVPSQQ